MFYLKQSKRAGFGVVSISLFAFPGSVPGVALGRCPVVGGSTRVGRSQEAEGPMALTGGLQSFVEASGVDGLVPMVS